MIKCTDRLLVELLLLPLAQSVGLKQDKYVIHICSFPKGQNAVSLGHC